MFAALAVLGIMAVQRGNEINRWKLYEEKMEKERELTEREMDEATIALESRHRTDLAKRAEMSADLESRHRTDLAKRDEELRKRSTGCKRDVESCNAERKIESVNCKNREAAAKFVCTNRIAAVEEEKANMGISLRNCLKREIDARASGVPLEFDGRKREELKHLDDLARYINHLQHLEKSSDHKKASTATRTLAQISKTLDNTLDKHLKGTGHERSKYRPLFVTPATKRPHPPMIHETPGPLPPLPNLQG